MNLEDNYSYYLIVQRIKDKKFTNKIETPANKDEIKKLIECLVGNISVYLYNENNSSKDLTNELGKIDKDIDFSKLNKIGSIKYTRIQSIENNEKVGEFFLRNLVVYTEEFIPKVFTYRGTKCKKRALYNMFDYDYFSNNNLKENNRKIEAGADYERYIAKKYIASGHNVIYYGIEKGVFDGGIDLIAIKENKVTLIQCKNWKDTGYKEVSDKDIRAFFGDCFKYILDNKLLDNTVAMHYIIANEETMNKSAHKYLKENTNIKYKCVPFVLDD